MKPVDRSDAHLQDRAAEIRAVKSLLVVVLLAGLALFLSWTAVFVAFGLGYVLYQYRYYTRRVGAYTNADLSVRHDRLEYGLFGFAAVTVGTLLAIWTVFDDSWGLGGFLSLPDVSFTSPETLLEEPMALVAWLVVLAPVVAVSYLGLQFRKRLLVGVDTRQAAIRATIWDGLGRLPVVVLWLLVVSARPVYEVWQPAVERLASEVGATPGTPGEFAVLFSGGFEAVLVGSVVAPGVVFTSYLVVQQQKYEDGTVPEVLGYRGLSPPFRGNHRVNVFVPVAVFGLYVAAVVLATQLGHLGDSSLAGSLPLLAGAAVAGGVGSDPLAVTTTTVRSVSTAAAEATDAVVTGLAAGLAVCLVLGLVQGSTPLGTLVLAYPLVAVPLSYGGNWLTGKRTAREFDAYSERVSADPDAFDEQTVDRLLTYSSARDTSLRSAAVRGLASSIGARAYRKQDTLVAFVDALESTETQLVHAGLRGIATDLSYDRDPETVDWLHGVGAVEQCLSRLDDEDEQTRSLAAETLARAYAIDVETRQHVEADRLTAPHLARLRSIAEADTENTPLVDAVVEYAATLLFVGTRSPNGLDATAGPVQQLLGDVLWLTEHTREHSRHRAAFAVTAGRAPADSQRLSRALDGLDSEYDTNRYLAAHVVRSSVDRHPDAIDADRLVSLLDDPSVAVRAVGADTLASLLAADPGRGGALQDRLLHHLEQHRDEPGRVEGGVVRALAEIPPDRLLDHPTAASTVATQVEADDRLVAEPAARLLTTLIDESVAVSRDDQVRHAVESGLTHASPEVRLACLEATVAMVVDAAENGQQFVEGLGANLSAEGRRGVLAAATLTQVVDDDPEQGLAIVPELAQGLANQTPVDSQTVPFLVRGDTVGALVVDIVRAVVSLDPSSGEGLIGPLVDLAPAADQSTLAGVVNTLSALSGEFPSTAQQAVDAAAAALEAGRTSTRSDAAQLLANVAAYHPETVEPHVDRLVVATEDDSPRVRAPALTALRNVCTALPAAIEADVHQVVGRLDDDSATVRKRAADLIATVAERQPEVVDPAAETADRLRRLQRDPAVDVDPGELQDASTAIQTGVASDEVDTADDEEIWTPESGDEMGVSGDTEVFEPVGDDFEPSLDEEFEAAPADTAEETETGAESAGLADREPDEGDGTDGVAARDTVVAPDESETGEHDAGPLETSSESSEGSGDDEPDVGSRETVVGPDDTENDDSDGIGTRDTVVGTDPPEGTGPTDDDPLSQDTVIAPDESGDDGGVADDIGSEETTIAPDETGDEDDVRAQGTAIEPEGDDEQHSDETEHQEDR